jgi:glycosyltransferase involved in cell wall biosynthesis
MMNILHIYKDYYPVLGGVENHIRVLAEAQTSSGHNVTVLVTNPRKNILTRNINGVCVILAGRLATIASMPISLSLPLILTRLQPHLIHIHSPFPLGELSVWIFRRSIPLVITHHSDVVRQKELLFLYKPLLRHILRHAKYIIATSPRYIETSPWLHPIQEKCVVIPPGVNVERFFPPAEAYVGPPTLLFVGRLRYYKGIDTLLRAMVSLPGVQLDIVGEGPERISLETIARNLRITDRVRFMGEVDNVNLPKIYRQAHLFVLPANARAEAFGAVLLEAMASGLPCVTTEVGTGTSWVVQDGLHGIVLPPREPELLAQAIGSLLKDPALRQKMGQAARQRVISEFSQSLMTHRVEELYRKALYFSPKK